MVIVRGKGDGLEVAHAGVNRGGGVGRATGCEVRAGCMDMGLEGRGEVRDKPRGGIRILNGMAVRRGTEARPSREGCEMLVVNMGHGEVAKIRVKKGCCSTDIRSIVTFCRGVRRNLL